MLDTPCPTPVYCVDVIARTKEGAFVCIERLHGQVRGLALPGGKIELGETVSAAALREVEEETGLHFTLHGVLMTCAELDRDPRGWYVSTVVYGSVSGVPSGEPGKTRVVLLTEPELRSRLDEFVLDHADMLRAYMQQGE